MNKNKFYNNFISMFVLIITFSFVFINTKVDASSKDNHQSYNLIKMSNKKYDLNLNRVKYYAKKHGMNIKRVSKKNLKNLNTIKINNTKELDDLLSGNYNQNILIAHSKKSHKKVSHKKKSHKKSSRKRRSHKRKVYKKTRVKTKRLYSNVFSHINGWVRFTERGNKILKVKHVWTTTSGINPSFSWTLKDAYTNIYRGRHAGKVTFIGQRTYYALTPVGVYKVFTNTLKLNLKFTA